MAAGLLFVLAMSSFADPAILGAGLHNFLANYLQNRYLNLGNPAQGAAIAVVMLVLMCLGFALFALLGGKRRTRNVTGHRRVRLPALVSAFCVFYLIAPTVIVLGASFTNTAQIRFPPAGLTLRWYSEILSNGSTWHALTNSLYVALISVVISLVAGVPAAMALPKLSGPRRIIIAVTLSLGLSTPHRVSVRPVRRLFAASSDSFGGCRGRGRGHR